jgi:hypothetical protein
MTWERWLRLKMLVAFILYGKRQSTSYKARCIRRWVDEYCERGKLSEHKQGRHAKKTIITDEDFGWTCCAEWLRSLKDEARTPEAYFHYLNDTFLPSLADGPSKISLSTATRWMRYLGFDKVKASKGWFTDSHERADIVRHRGQFLEAMAEVEKRMDSYSQWRQLGRDNRT